MPMKLYELKKDSRFRIVSKDPVTPPSSNELEYGDILTLDHVDGMYSYCIDNRGNVRHPAAFTDVEEIK